MRVPHFTLPFLMLPALAATAQANHKTQAQLDQLNGPVRSVATQVLTAPIKWSQPGGPTLVMPVWCRDCQYDRDGNRTLSGQFQPDGAFFGETIDMVRDPQGHVVERTRTNSSDGKIIERDKYGPFGPVEETYFNGPIVRSTKTYDRLGNLSEWLSFDAAGQEVSRGITRTNADGQWTEHAGWKNGQLEYRETYDPETDFQRFESYDDSGAVRVSFTFSHNKIQTFWEASDEPNQFGDSVSAKIGKGDFDEFKCHKSGMCDVIHVHYTYADSSELFPATAEWRDASGKLQYASWCQYEFDDHHNWTRRTVWVQSPEIPQRTLYETDSRTITYWPDR